MPIIEEHVVEEEGLRLDRWAVENFSNLPSRASARKACKRGDILLNGAPAETSRFVRIGDRVSLAESESLRPICEVALQVVYRDPELAVVYKPAGILTNGNRHRTLEHALPMALGRSSAPGSLLTPRPVHRLDYETTGLVVVARTAGALMQLGRAFEARDVHKRYRAILVGRLEGEGEICEPLDGRPAQTRWKVVGWNRSLKVKWCTTVELTPCTGRMHQLRRHMLSIGHGILGDHRYVDGPVYQKNGLFLSAVALDLPHPTTGDRLILSVAEPRKFSAFRKREQRRWEKWFPACESAAGGDDVEGG